MNGKKKVIWVVGMFILLFWLVQHSKSVDAFIQEAKDHTGHAVTPVGMANVIDKNRDQQLRALIEKEAAKRKIAPDNAIADQVWKAIPGLNGLEVDIMKTYKLALKSKALNKQSLEGIPFVYKEISPQIDLDDLGPMPIFKGNPNKPMVSIMINVAWGNEYLPKIIEVLDSENVHSTFFLDGSWLEKNEGMAKEIMMHGHELASHAYSHKNMSQLSRAKAWEEMAQTQELLHKLKIDNHLFAPPSGDFDQDTVQIAHELGMRTILWTIDTVDWKKPSPEWIVRKISQRLEPGSLIWMHPTDSSSAALQPMIQEIKRRGLVLGTVSELISPNRLPSIEGGHIF